MGDNREEAYSELLYAAEAYTKGYDGPGTARDQEARLLAAAIEYAKCSSPMPGPAGHVLKAGASVCDRCGVVWMQNEHGTRPSCGMGSPVCEEWAAQAPGPAPTKERP